MYSLSNGQIEHSIASQTDTGTRLCVSVLPEKMIACMVCCFIYQVIQFEALLDSILFYLRHADLAVSASNFAWAIYMGDCGVGSSL